ncbi:HK97 family phage prohead protease [Phocaeicola paurosaccharolyticus]|uniref:HK97 family phage prohead protease n=1 Tax=Phocaeicola paurosaccharolyticus TaxID=732242 RepID=UPI00046A8965|nr:HK97 family phage prohead protease [Phocaeicola paurosaccharolyticus]
MKETRNNETEFKVESRSIVGYALKFNTESKDLGGFTEIIADTALDGVLIRSDVLCLMNHDIDRGVLARSRKGKGSLKLTIDKEGLKYEFEAPNTALGDELLESVKRGDISSSSFAFCIDKDQWDKKEDGSYKRTIVAFRELYDVSPVYYPAYDATSVSIDKRGFDLLKEKETEELKEYFNNLKSKIK